MLNSNRGPASMYLIHGLPVYHARASYVSDGVRYDFDGVINQGLLKHVLPPGLVRMMVNNPSFSGFLPDNDN